MNWLRRWFTWTWSINAGTGRRTRLLRINLRPIYIPLWSWTDPALDPEEDA